MASPIRCAGENWEVGESQGWTSKTGFCSHVFKQSRQWKVGIRVGRSGLVALSGNGDGDGSRAWRILSRQSGPEQHSAPN